MGSTDLRGWRGQSVHRGQHDFALPYPEGLASASEQNTQSVNSLLVEALCTSEPPPWTPGLPSSHPHLLAYPRLVLAHLPFQSYFEVQQKLWTGTFGATGKVKGHHLVTEPTMATALGSGINRTRMARQGTKSFTCSVSLSTFLSLSGPELSRLSKEWH